MQEYTKPVSILGTGLNTNDFFIKQKIKKFLKAPRYKDIKAFIVDDSFIKDVEHIVYMTATHEVTIQFGVALIDATKTNVVIYKLRNNTILLRGEI